jgi:alginate O-acetyltransferase complex protein AlgI
MVFASNIFILFMALMLPVFALATRWNPKSGKPLLIALSLFFYSYWLPIYLLLILGSMAVNYAIGVWAIRPADQRKRKIAVTLGIAANLILLGYFKYYGFFVENIQTLLGIQGDVPRIALPLGISFFTFQQISFLIEVYRRHVDRVDLTNYVLFVSFFPQLIAGPIVTQSEMLPQLRRKTNWRLRPDHFSLGFFLFSAGLFKKSVLIDPYVPFIDIVFDHAAAGHAVSFLDAWTGAIGYSFQIYLDFSGYSDMAIGLALIFGLKLPVNFFSPYKAASIREFWRRWHITLSRFLQEFLYIPFGGSRHGHGRTMLALVGTMTLGGLWHGAGWQFILWGALHGVMLVINHLWAELTRASPVLTWISRTMIYRPLMVVLTFAALAVTWVFFRAPDLESALRIVSGMFGLTDTASVTSLEKGIALAFPVYFIFVWALPNTIQITKRFPVSLRPAAFAKEMRLAPKRRWLEFRFNLIWALFSLVLFLAGWFSLSNLSPFIYFQF